MARARAAALDVTPLLLNGDPRDRDAVVHALTGVARALAEGDDGGSGRLGLLVTDPKIVRGQAVRVLEQAAPGWGDRLSSGRARLFLSGEGGEGVFANGYVSLAALKRGLGDPPSLSLFGVSPELIDPADRRRLDALGVAWIPLGRPFSEELEAGLARLQFLHIQA
ncbi:MAG: hypothetical protein IPP35_09565 [Elusimicrobia bacterium]|nr:hypothetical protein [Elusimicrobiota bacterium]